MKTKLLALIFCFATFFVSAENSINDINASYKYSKKRTIDANFETIVGTSVALIGKYSDYKISSWEENYVSFHVEIIAKANKEEYAEEMLYAIDVDFNNEKNKQKLTAKTIINKINAKNVGYHISYYIMLPQDVFVSIYNIYGDVIMDKANNNLYVEMQYGDFSIDDIVSTAEIKMNYGDVNIKKAKQINAKINYGDIDIADVNNAVFKMNYGSIKLDNVNRLIGELNYSDINVNNIEKYADIYVNYGDVTVNKISQAFESMKVQLNYSDIILNLTEDMSFTYDIKLLYGDIENDLLEKYAKRIVETKVNTKTMTGNINDSEGKHKITINGNYSDVE